jgi:hypothetical protein
MRTTARPEAEKPSFRTISPLPYKAFSGDFIDRRSFPRESW